MASEVVFDWGAAHPKRVDVMEFSPAGATYASDIEKGTFTCYEIKSCKEDLFSGSGLNFFGEHNYIVTTMETWKGLVEDAIKEGVLIQYTISKYISENFPESNTNFGVQVVCPMSRTIESEWEDPTPIPEDGNASGWITKTVVKCQGAKRKRGMSEMLFCMLRAASRA